MNRETMHKMFGIPMDWKSVMEKPYIGWDFSLVKIGPNGNVRPPDVDLELSSGGIYTLPGMMERRENFILIDVKLTDEGMREAVVRSFRAKAKNENELCLVCTSYKYEENGYRIFLPNSATVIMPNAEDDWTFECDINQFNARGNRWYNQPSLGRNGFTDPI